MLFKLSNLNLNLALTLGYLNLALNNWAQSNNQEFGTSGSVITIGLSRQDKTRFISLSSVYMWQIEKKREI